MDYKFGVALFVSAIICTAQALPPCTCTRNYLPICGSNGETYSNQCLLDCARYNTHQDITVVKQGPCESEQQTVVVGESCVCPLLYLPVCGSDGSTYPNECNLNCKKQDFPGLALRHAGACVEANEEAPVCVCTREKKPVCGSNGNTYANTCLLNCASAKDATLRMAHPGPCQDRVNIQEPRVQLY
ncbi:hypothetical protein SFRURICE_016180 [Spodoptera frugiperda]|uniref:SFRICE_002529 n=1 Tax=Spodoptera frugiperda TaxID=7108 RepID=A0A2H1WCW0_SPOFR|nr:hypothetical protein SFRURICE_016180 [Spodoptera frugiperda]